MSDLVVDTYGGPGGWEVAMRMLGLKHVVGIEWDAPACQTRAAAGHTTIRADVSRFDVTPLAGRLWGSVNSPPCIVFSGAGNRAGAHVMHILADGIRDAMAGRPTRAQKRREMVSALRSSRWLVPGPAPRIDPAKWRRDKQAAWKRTLLARKGSPAKLRRAITSAPPGRHLTRAQRSARIRAAVLSASQVIEPARFIHAGNPEWVTLEQVPEVLPLWRVYVAELKKRGYSAWCGKLNAADYGVPQTRERAILIASRVRRVSRPVPTHYNPRKGDQLWGEPWVSMAEALGWGATGRPAPTATAGGTSLGGYEPFAKGGRECLAREMEAGRWALRRSRSALVHRRDDPADEPAPTITSAGSKVGANLTWVLHTNRGQEPDGTRQTVDPSTAPAPALTAKSGAQWKVKPNEQWVLRTSFGKPAAGAKSTGTGSHGTHEMDPATRPSHTVTGKAKDWAAWVTDRPATTVQGDPLAGRPGHKDRDRGESQFAQDSVRITVEEAAILQSFPQGYPWRGTRTAQFRQVGDAFPPRLAAHVLAMATGASLAALAAETTPESAA